MTAAATSRGMSVPAPAQPFWTRRQVYAYELQARYLIRSWGMGEEARAVLADLRAARADARPVITIATDLL